MKIDDGENRQMDTIDALNIAKRVGRAAFGSLNKASAQILAENLSYTFSQQIVSSDTFVQVFMQEFTAPDQAELR